MNPTLWSQIHEQVVDLPRDSFRKRVNEDITIAINKQARIVTQQIKDQLYIAIRGNIINIGDRIQQNCMDMYGYY